MVAGVLLMFDEGTKATPLQFTRDASRQLFITPVLFSSLPHLA
jgi:hypothetical protein